MSDSINYMLHGLLGVELTAVLWIVWQLFKLLREIRAEIEKKGKTP